MSEEDIDMAKDNEQQQQPEPQPEQPQPEQPQPEQPQPEGDQPVSPAEDQERRIKRAEEQLEADEG